MTEGNIRNTFFFHEFSNNVKRLFGVFAHTILSLYIKREYQMFRYKCLRQSVLSLTMIGILADMMERLV